MPDSASPKNKTRVMFVDTRQQEGKHALKHAGLVELGYELRRTKLYVGDYQLPGGLTVVDTKQGILELHGDVTRDHARFRNELVKAQECGIDLWILTENGAGVSNLADLAAWVEPPGQFLQRAKRGAKRPIKGEPMAKACATMARRYGAHFVFCAPASTAKNIDWILSGKGG